MGLRALKGVLFALGLYTSCFVLIEALPGDAADRLDDPTIPVEQAERARRSLGLDRSPVERWMSGLLALGRGDLGTSLIYRRPVADVLQDAWLATFLLGAVTLIATYVGGTLIALCLASWSSAAWRGWRAVDGLLVGLGFLPTVVLGPLLISLFALRLGWLPASHTAPVGADPGAIDLRHLVLPVLTLAVPATAMVARRTLFEFRAESSLAAVQAAIARGMSWPRVVWRHLMPVAGPAMFGMLALDAPVLVSGAVVVETLFAWPGIGRRTYESIVGLDTSLALATCLSVSIVVAASRLCSQAISTWLDPRRSQTDAP